MPEAATIITAANTQAGTFSNDECLGFLSLHPVDTDAIVAYDVEALASGERVQAKPVATVAVSGEAERRQFF
jgi:hypothetical protein